MPFPAFGDQRAVTAIPTCGQQEEHHAKNAAEKDELLQGIVSQQPFRTQIEAQAGGNAEQQIGYRRAEMIVRRMSCFVHRFLRQQGLSRYHLVVLERYSASVQKTASKVQLRFIVIVL